MAGYSLGEVMGHFASRPGKSPSLPTVRRYYNMDAVPEDIRANYRKEMAFDSEPFKSAIIDIVANNPGCYASSIYDVLEERFLGSGEYESLPGNAQTLRNFIHRLKADGAIGLEPRKRRTYDHVDDSKIGHQVLIDFGEEDCGHGLIVHFICLLLRYSRLLGVYAQDHKFNAEEACRAIYRFFMKCAGRPRELAIDQDSVFVASEEYGEVIETKVFKDFLTEQSLVLWTCNKADPESKGPIENTVGLTKKNYFSARTFTSIEQVQRTLPAWCERKNKRIHQATFKVPAAQFEKIEKAALAPLIPSVYEASPVGLISVKVGSMPYISHKYSVPWELCFSTVFIKAIGEKLHVYGSDRKHLCTHQLNPAKGSFNRLDEHEREPSTEWMVIAERMRKKYNCLKFTHFINGFKKENGRHLAKQLLAVERFLDGERAPLGLVAEVFDQCCDQWRYRFSQFQVAFDEAKARWGETAANTEDTQLTMSEVDKRSLDAYQDAFNKRCAG